MTTEVKTFKVGDKVQVKDGNSLNHKSVGRISQILPEDKYRIKLAPNVYVKEHANSLVKL